MGRLCFFIEKAGNRPGREISGLLLAELLHVLEHRANGEDNNDKDDGGDDIVDHGGNPPFVDGVG